MMCVLSGAVSFDLKQFLCVVMRTRACVRKHAWMRVNVWVHLCVYTFVHCLAAVLPVLSRASASGCTNFVSKGSARTRVTCKLLHVRTPTFAAAGVHSTLAHKTTHAAGVWPRAVRAR